MPRHRLDPVQVSVVTSGHDVADARLHREVAALRAAGMTVEVLGLGDRREGPVGATVRTWPRRGMLARALLAARLPLLARGSVVLALDPDSGLTTCLLAPRRGRRVVVDVHEDYAALLRDRAWARRFRGLPGAAGLRLVRFGLRRFEDADLVVVADEHVPPPTARRRLVVRNMPDTAMLPSPGPKSPEPRALYVGDLRASRGLFAMVESVRRAPGWHLDLVGPVAPADAARLDAVLGADPELAARVHRHGRQPPEQAWRIGASSWVGLVLLTATPAFIDAVPSKLYEYLACGLPVISTDLPRSAELVRSAGASAIVAAGDDDAVADQVARTLRRWADNPDEIDALRERVAMEAAQVTARRTPYETLADAILDLTTSRGPLPATPAPRSGSVRTEPDRSPSLEEH